MWDRNFGGRGNSPMLQQQRKKKKSRIKHLRKSHVQIRIAKKNSLGDGGQLFSAMIILNEFTAENLNIFSNTHLNPGDEVSVVIRSFQNDGNTVYVRSRVNWVKDNVTQSQKVISKERFRYRIGLDIIAQNEEERSQLNDCRLRLVSGLLAA